MFREFLRSLREMGTPFVGRKLARRTGVEGTLGQPLIQTQADTVESAERRRNRVTTGKSATGRYVLPSLTDTFTGETAAHRAAYKKMLAEPSVKAALLSKILSVAPLDLVVTPEDPENRKERDAAEFIRWSLLNVGRGEQGQPVGISHMLLNLSVPKMIDGYVIAHKRYAPVTSGKWSGRYGLADCIAKPTDAYDLEVDEFGRLQQIVGRSHNGGETFDPSGFVYGRFLPLWGNPRGMSDLRAAYRAYVLKDLAWKLRAIYQEKFAVGTLKGTYASDDQQALLEEAMRNFRGGTWIAVPEGVLLEAIQISTRGDADYAAAIRDLDREVFVGVTGAFLQAIEGATTGARATGEVHRSTSELMQWYVAEDLAGDINSQIVPDLVGFNFAGGVTLPTVSFGGVNDADLLPSLQLDEGLQRLGYKLSRKEAGQRYKRAWASDAADEMVPASVASSPPMGGLMGFADAGSGVAGIDPFRVPSFRRT